MQERAIEQANFNPKVKQYWTLVVVFVTAATILGIVFTPLVAIIAWLISGKVLKALSANLYERKLVVKRGILFVVEKSIPLEKITDIALSQGPLMRLFGLHKLSFETAGQSGQGALVSLVGVIDAENFRERILNQKDALRLKQDSASVKTEPSHRNENTDLVSLNQSVKNIENMLAELLARSK
jgi:putative membrane protein